jgi:hypothetical protein
MEPVKDSPLSYSANELYYSGGILHQAKISSPSVTLKSKQAMHQFEQMNTDPTEHAKESENNLDQRGDKVGLYNILKIDFTSSIKLKRKKSSFASSAVNQIYKLTVCGVTGHLKHS